MLKTGGCRLFAPFALALPRRRFPSHLFMSFSSKPQPGHNSKVLIFGAGNFGSCLASHLGDSQHDVYMWAREEYLVKHFNLNHRNPTYLTDHEFPSNITAVGPALPDAGLINKVDVLLFAIPTQFLR
jgi:hypothetical protein